MEIKKEIRVTITKLTFDTKNLIQFNEKELKDANNGYPSNVYTDINPGPSKAYYFYGLHLKYRF